ncbi:MAG: hypothetical protein KAR00_02960 [Candidatus Pacebacteria bacterium]|nr:hypothetical protein [Candidatus Paceibacterota bacterium]
MKEKKKELLEIALNKALEKREKDKERRKLKFIQWIVALYSIALLFSSLFLLVSLKIGGILFIVNVIYSLASFKTVSSNELGVVRLFGEAVAELESGLCFVPLGICELKTYPKSTQVIEIGSPLEDDEGKPIPKEKIQRTGVVINDTPFRIPLKGDPESKNVMDHALTVDSRAQVQYVVESTIAFDEQKRDPNLANNELIEVLKTAVQKLYGDKTPKMVLELISSGRINDVLQEELEWLIGEPTSQPPSVLSGKEPEENKEETKEKEWEWVENKRPWWGIDILSVGITTLGLPRRVNEGLADARKREILAEADEVQRVKAGTGDAFALSARLDAEATGLKKKAKVGKTVEGKRVIELETVQQTFKNTEKIIVTPSEGLMSTVMGLSQAVKETSSSSKKSAIEKETVKK